MSVTDTRNELASNFLQRLVSDVLKDFEIVKKQGVRAIPNCAPNMINMTQELSEDRENRNVLVLVQMKPSMKV